MIQNKHKQQPVDGAGAPIDKKRKGRGLLRKTNLHGCGDKHFYVVLILWRKRLLKEIEK